MPSIRPRPGIGPGARLFPSLALRVEPDSSRARLDAESCSPHHQSCAQSRARARTAGARPGARERLGKVLPLAHALARSSLLGRLVRFAKSARTLGDERADEWSRAGGRLDPRRRHAAQSTVRLPYAPSSALRLSSANTGQRPARTPAARTASSPSASPLVLARARPGAHGFGTSASVFMNSWIGVAGIVTIST